MADKPALYPCIRCGRMPDEKDKFCTDCGAPVYNRCSDEPGILKKGCSFINPPNAAFCARCGEPTVYQLHGLLPAHYPSGNKPAFLGFK